MNSNTGTASELDLPTYYLVWSIQWALAFPELLSTGLYCQLQEHNESGSIITDTQADKSSVKLPDKSSNRSGCHECYYFNTLCLIAFRSVFSITIPCEEFKHKNNSFNGNLRNNSFVAADWEQYRHVRVAGAHCAAVDSRCLGYGEITPQSTFRVMHRIYQIEKRQRKFGLLSRRKIIDLGSGSGRVLIASALAGGFRDAIGIEIVRNLHQEALKNLSAWHDSILYYSRHFHKNKASVSKENKVNLMKLEFDGNYHDHLSTSIMPRTRFHFISGNFADTEHRGLLINSTDVVIVHATLFDDQLMASVQSLCQSCKEGTYFVMVTRPLVTCETTIATDGANGAYSSTLGVKVRSTCNKERVENDGNLNTNRKTKAKIVTLDVLQLPMSWGLANVFIQQLVCLWTNQ